MHERNINRRIPFQHYEHARKAHLGLVLRAVTVVDNQTAFIAHPSRDVYEHPVLHKCAAQGGKRISVVVGDRVVIFPQKLREALHGSAQRAVDDSVFELRALRLAEPVFDLYAQRRTRRQSLERLDILRHEIGLVLRLREQFAERSVAVPLVFRCRNSAEHERSDEIAPTGIDPALETFADKFRLRQKEFRQGISGRLFHNPYR